LNILLACGIQNYLNGDTIVLFDEYHWAITETPYSFNSIKKFPLVFTVGLHCPMIFFTGHESRNFSTFCKEHFGTFAQHSHGKIINSSAANQQVD
jgi:hypothetical protein